MYYSTFICLKADRKTKTSFHLFTIFFIKETYLNLTAITLCHSMVGWPANGTDSGMNLRMHYVLCLSIFSFSKLYNFGKMRVSRRCHGQLPMKIAVFTKVDSPLVSERLALRIVFRDLHTNPNQKLDRLEALYRK